MGMRICVLTGSPHLKGTSNTLAEEWMRGAQAAGHTVERCDCARLNLHPCLGCGHCGMDGSCVHRDDGDGVLCPTALWGGNVGKKRVQFLPVKE